MADPKEPENPAQTAGTVAGRAATVRPRQEIEESASPGAAEDQKTLASDNKD